MLKIDHLSFGVENEGGKKEIIKDVSFEARDGELIVITGPNGGGKSTLAKLIAGIETPTSGRIFLDGEDLSSLSVTERANRGISYAFQQPVRFKGIRVIDLLRLASKKELKVSEACSYLSSVGLCARDYVEREVNASLSGGELKRIEIATVLARSTSVSLFDEPEAGIDLWSFRNLIDVFKKMKETTHGTILIISHQERILRIADRILVLANGQLVQQGAADALLPNLLSGSMSDMTACYESREGGRNDA